MLRIASKQFVSCAFLSERRFNHSIKDKTNKPVSMISAALWQH